MNIKISTLVWTFLFSLLMGVTAISIGFGAVFPQINYVAAPYVCPKGTMSTTSKTYNIAPGNTETTITFYCTDKSTGTKKVVSIFPMDFYAGLIYGVLLFLIILLVMMINRFAGMISSNKETADKWGKALRVIGGIIAAIGILFLLLFLLFLFIPGGDPVEDIIADIICIPLPLILLGWGVFAWGTSLRKLKNINS